MKTGLRNVRGMRKSEIAFHRKYSELQRQKAAKKPPQRVAKTQTKETLGEKS